VTRDATDGWRKFAVSMMSAAGFLVSFWNEDGEKYRQDTKQSGEVTGGGRHAKEILKNKVPSHCPLESLLLKPWRQVSWVLGVFVFVNWGAEGIVHDP
jgi:hypothetical protein